MNTHSISSPTLGKPGAGLPFYEWAVAKYFIFPHRFKTVDNEQAISDFAEESKKILTLARELSESELCEKRLVKRLRGMEDNSRFWSVAMAIEHLIIADNAVRGVILALASGKVDLPKSTIENMKPDPLVKPDGLLERFEQTSQKFVSTATSAKINAFPQATYEHPWFGPLNARKWLCFAGPHQRVHRQQIEEITKLLRLEKQIP
jgi:hypothetical protein